MYPDKFNDVIQNFSKLSGVGEKSAERMAFDLMDWNQWELDDFAKSLQALKDLHECSVCGNLTDQEVCEICSNDKRDQNKICVVEDSKTLYVIENLNAYNGLYHVLGGLINPRKGVMPDSLSITQLEDRLKTGQEEVILALDPTIEGETTSMYLEELLKDKATVTRLAYGIPVGGKVNYADERTLIKALEGRK